MKRVDVIVGIPSYNEIKTIGFVAKQIDKGLIKYFPKSRALIVNVDNYSSDGTGDAFLNTKTKTPKIYISTPKNEKGKGYNFYNLFKLAKKMDAKTVAVFDADLKSVRPEWVKRLVGPVKQGKFDFVFPYYYRHPYDATITNHICYPLIYGLLGIDVRQPIGGEFAFNRKVVGFLLKKKWSKSVKKYGVDIFMSLSVIMNNLKIGQVNLGVKIHRSSAPKLNDMFDQVVMTAFRTFFDNKRKWNKKIKKAKKIPVMFDSLRAKKVPPPSGIDRFYRKKNSFIDAELWAKSVYNVMHEFYKTGYNPKTIDVLKLLYFSRIVSFIKETKKLPRKEAESLIKNQAKIFFKKRDYFLGKI